MHGTCFFVCVFDQVELAFRERREAAQKRVFTVDAMSMTTHSRSPSTTGSVGSRVNFSSFCSPPPNLHISLRFHIGDILICYTSVKICFLWVDYS